MPRSDNAFFRMLVDLGIARARSSEASEIDDEPQRDPNAAAEAEARKQRSIAILIRERRAHQPALADDRGGSGDAAPGDGRGGAARHRAHGRGREGRKPRPGADAGPKAVGVIVNLGRDRFVAQAALRPAGELLDAADLIYRYHWATREAELRGREPPAGLDPGVVMERHYALNWLIGYLGLDWDEVSTDT